ncbi:MAG: aldo/keto reductase [Prevotella sp.]|nr:aldo/keto reductase [Prevotella sp.]
MNEIKLSNGVLMPQMGYGVYQIEPEDCERCVMDAISVGYRMIDTAQAYLNEEAVGKAWKKSGVRREDLFLVNKVWHSNYGEGQTMKSIDESLRKLQTDYIDLMLLHQPFCDRYGAYRDLEKAYKAGKVRAIGVSNFFPDHLVDLAANMEIAPMVNQVETHVFDQQREARKYMDEIGTHIMSWAPLAEGQNNLFSNPVLTKIGEKYGKTAAQVALRWLLQSDVIIIPKTVHKSRMEENLNLFDFTLDADDMEAIALLDTGHSLFLDHHDGEVAKQFMEWRAVVKPTE